MIKMGGTWVVFVAFATTAALAFQCQDWQECSCQPSHRGDYEIHCPTRNDAAFFVNVLPSEYIQVECRKSPNWTDFHLTDVLPGSLIKSMYFRMCDIPSNMSLGSIARRLGATSVESLWFQSFGNLSSTLRRHHLQDLPNLKRLTLSSNSLSNLSSDLLEDLPELTWFDLRDNNVQLSPGIFDHTPKLEVLELGNNMIDRIEPGTFDKLEKLRFLNLWRNRLQEIELGTFDKLTSLKSLDLNSNNLESLPFNVLHGLVNLETLNLFGNNFSALPEGLLDNCTKLRTVNIYNNKRNLTTLPSGFFGNLTELKMVKLKRNGLIELPENLFWGATSLTNVTLERNYLKTLPSTIFRGSAQLGTLDLNFNDLENLPERMFSDAVHMVKLDLSKNRLTTISRHMFDGLISLTELNVENNRLQLIEDLALSPLHNLRIARFSNNQLNLKSSILQYSDEYGPKSPFHPCSNLEELYLAKNNITEIFSDWNVSGPKLRILDLKYNNLPFITAEDLQFTSKNIRVDLTHNNISHIHLHVAETIAMYQSIPRDVIILVEHNPLTCDCFLYDFLRYLEGRMHPYVQNYFHIIPGNLTCRSPSWLEDVAISNLKSSSLRCLVDNSKKREICPEVCDCWIQPNDMAYVVDCSHRNLTQLPKNIKRPNNQYHVELNFTGNSLTTIPSMKELGVENVTVVLLSHNNITDISVAGLPSTLQVLELHDNNITRVSSSVLEYIKNFTSLSQLTLHGNAWRCDCNAREFLSFIQTKFGKIPDLREVTCQGTNVSISEMTPIEFCPPETGMIVGVSLAIALTGLVLGILAALYYRCQQEIKVWLYAHQCCLWFVTEDELDKDKLYDAFISYSHKDEDFVVNELLSKLENGPRPFKLCLHFRDWLAGEWIPTQIARSVEDSKRTIVVLSPNFLESVWGRMEFRAAHRQALSEGRARVILILYGEIGPTDDLDPELKAYISMNTYVKWGDPWFWDKLRYALPHPPELTKGAMRKRIFERHQPTIQISGEKKELIRPHGVPETPPAITTPPADAFKVFICDGDTAKELDECQNNEKVDADYRTEVSFNDCRKEMSFDGYQPEGSFNNCQNETKLNGVVKQPTFVATHDLIKNHSIFNKIQCTTV